MAQRRLNHLGLTGRGPVAQAIVRGAQVRAPLHHLARDANVGLLWVIALPRETVYDSKVTATLPICGWASHDSCSKEMLFPF
jgi:hypothetical protein